MSSRRTLNTFVTNLVDRFAFDTYGIDAKSQALFRIFYASLFLVIGGLPSWVWIGDKPSVLFQPPPISLTNFVASSFPPAGFFISLEIIVCLLYVALLFGFYTRITSVLLAVFLTIGFSFEFSFGKIGHFAMLMILVPLMMSFSNWGTLWSIDARYRHAQPNPNRAAWPIAFMVLCFGFAMFSASVPKIIAGWLDPATQAVRGYMLRFYYVQGSRELLLPYLVDFTSKGVWEAMDWMGVGLELTFLLAILRRQLFRFYLLVTISFHIANLLIFNINDFYLNTYFYALFFNYTLITERMSPLASQRLGSFFNYVNLALVAGAAVVWYRFFTLSPFFTALEALSLNFDEATLVLLFAMLALALTDAVLSLRQRQPTPAVGAL
ncbi:HTTM domain-containing protein [Catalinimonas alkaloidigena]|uniref:HTTM domain-containing protein n=1 Tax=Catalinimonas alkaloidigena TaxID=1075417 RepID=UPI000AEA2AC6|nr:HTTM domain-containing protein [Catalinimonas alkaloidigena]